MGSKGLLLPAWASLTTISARGSSYGSTARPPPILHTSSSHPKSPPRHTHAARRGPGTLELWGACPGGAGRGELGYSWMLVPSLLSPSVRAGQWSPVFRDQNKEESPKPGEPGRSLQESLQTHTLSLSPSPIWGTSLEMTRVVLGSPTPSPGLRFPLCDKRAKGGPGAGRGGRRMKELGVFRPEKGTAFCGVDPRRDSPRASPALTVQGQEVPARVHARRAARREPGAAGHTCAVTAPAVSGPSPALWRPEWTVVGGGRRWARTSPRPPGPPTRVSPRPLLGIGEGGQRWDWEARLTLAAGG